MYTQYILCTHTHTYTHTCASVSFARLRVKYQEQCHPLLGWQKKTWTRRTTTSSMCDCDSLATLHGGLWLLLHDLWTFTLGGCCCRKSKGLTKIDTHTHTRSILHMCVHIHKYIYIYIHMYVFAHPPTRTHNISMTTVILYSTPPSLTLLSFWLTSRTPTHTHTHTNVGKFVFI